MAARFRSSSIMKMTAILEEVENHATFHGPLNKQRAEEMLKERDKNSHLTRFSVTRHVYILSVVNKKKWHKMALEHFDIEANKLNNTVLYRLKGCSEKRGSFSELLGYYQNARVSRKISGIGSGIHCSKTEITERLNLGIEEETDAHDLKFKIEPQGDTESEERAEEMDKHTYASNKKQTPSVDYSWQMRSICEHPCYHGAMTDREAEKTLKEFGRGCFLTRYSEKESLYYLSMLTIGEDFIFQHFKIKITEHLNGPVYEIEGVRMEMSEFLSFYQSAPILHQSESDESTRI